MYVVETGLCVEGGVGLLKLHQLSLPSLSIPPLISNVLHKQQFLRLRYVRHYRHITESYDWVFLLRTDPLPFPSSKLFVR